VDLFPTVADIVGLPESSFIQPLDGVSLKPLLQGEEGPRGKPLPFRFGTKVALIGDQYKLLTQNVAGSEFELYDLKADPNETRDLCATEPAVFEAMKKELLAWNESVEASFAGKDYPEGKVTPADPEPVNWWEAAPYLSYLPEWKSYWAYASYMNRTPGKGTGTGTGKGGKKGKKK
jgi:hypothetical protein